MCSSLSRLLRGEAAHQTVVVNGSFPGSPNEPPIVSVPSKRGVTRVPASICYYDDDAGKRSLLAADVRVVAVVRTFADQVLPVSPLACWCLRPWQRQQMWRAAAALSWTPSTWAVVHRCLTPGRLCQSLRAARDPLGGCWHRTRSDPAFF